MAKHFNTKMKERYAQFQHWVEKQESRGINITAQTKRFATSYDAFKERYNDLVREHRRTGSKETAMQAMRERAYEGGTRKQISMYVDAVSEGMEDLKISDPIMYERLNEKYGYESFDINAIVKEQHAGSGMYLNNSFKKGSLFGGDPGILQALYYELINAGIEVHFDSPKN